MSALRLLLDGHQLDHVEHDISRRVASLSLYPLRVPATSSTASEPVSSCASLPASPFSDSITSLETDSDGPVSSIDRSSLSPAPSLYSLTESLREQSLRLEHGRGVNTHSEIYKLAGDDEEADRLDRQHRFLKYFMGDYVPSMREILANNGDIHSPKACLDVGCGSGAWVLEVAREFPHVSCIAVDLVPLPTLVEVPSNFYFEIDDVSLGLEHFAGDFDVFHARLISMGIKDYYRLIDDAALALRPRGLADFTEYDFRIYDLEKRPIVPTMREIWGEVEPPDGWTGTGMARSGDSPAGRTSKSGSGSVAPPPSPFLARFATLIRQAVRKRGGHIDAASLLHRWMSQHRAFEDVVYREFWLPCSAWVCKKEVQKHPDFTGMSSEELEKLCQAGQEARDDAIGLMRSARPLLLSTGVPEAVVNYLQENAVREVREARIPMYARIQNVCARKKVTQPDVGTLVHTAISRARSSPLSFV